MSIGATLKEARKKKDITYEDVHAKIKIHPRVLQLLEEDKFEKLPSPLFAKSFLKSYAEFLGVNTEDLIKMYEKDAKKEPEQILFIRPAAEKDSPPPAFEIKYLLVPILVLGVLLAAFILAWGINAVAGYVSNVTSRERTPVKRTAVARPAAKRQVPMPIAPPKPVTKKAEWLRSVEMGDFPKINKRIPIDLQIRALETVWMQVTADGAKVYEGILKRGDAQAWSAKSNFKIWSGNASNMALTVNKAAIGSPGKGFANRMVLTREGVKVAPKEKS